MTSHAIKRIITHWTAGSGFASELDKKHYHRLIEADGNIVFGNEEIADNIVTADGDYAAHTLNLNRGSIGVATCGMRGAKESPFDAGTDPILEPQFRSFCRMVGKLCLEYDIPVSSTTVLSHAEVQGTLGVRQRGKWDFTRLVFRPDLIGPKAVGDYMRALICELLDIVPLRDIPVTLRLGSRGVEVEDLQTRLSELGFHSGAVDRVFGPATQASVMAFQASRNLLTDGVVGLATHEALRVRKSNPNPLVQGREGVTLGAMRRKGSRTIQAADTAQTGTAVAAGLGLANEFVADLRVDPLATVEQAQSQVERFQNLGLASGAFSWVLDNWLLLAAGAVVIVVIANMQAVKKARLSDHTSGKNVGR